ncbi:hypothetical protein GW17_00042861 [Ensete ventricosum]|nr:hypothetical protein GW17_00042861 [Ensete ventricosum]
MLPDRCRGRPHLPLQLRSSSSANRAIAFLNLCPTALPPLLCRRLSGPLLHPLSRAPLLPPCWTRSNIRSTPISPASCALLYHRSRFYPAAAAASRCCLGRFICYSLESPLPQPCFFLPYRCIVCSLWLFPPSAARHSQLSVCRSFPLLLSSSQSAVVASAVVASSPALATALVVATVTVAPLRRPPLLHLPPANSASPPTAVIAPKRRRNYRRPTLSPPAQATLLLLCSPSRQRASRLHLSLLPSRSSTILSSPKLQQPASIAATISDVPSHHYRRSYLSAPIASHCCRTCSCHWPLLFIPFALPLCSLSPPTI